MIGVEPPREFIEEWEGGDFNVYRPIAWQYAAWAYWYLGYDDPMIRASDPVTNGMIQKITDACVLRLKELDSEPV
jgi:hypothetical protein